jgi:hypothetical protein
MTINKKQHHQHNGFANSKAFPYNNRPYRTGDSQRNNGSNNDREQQ